MSTKKLQILGSLGGNKIYVQNDEPIDATEGAVWIDMDDTGSENFATKDEISVLESNVNSTFAAIKAVSVTLYASDWTGDAAPYSQTIIIDEMTEDWIPGIPIIPVVPGIAMSEKQAMQEDLACLSQITSGNGELTIACYENKPQGDLNIMIPGVV